MKIGTGTIVDPTILAAPSSTKNKAGARDPEMHQTRKGNEWHFDMKAHLGVNVETKLVYTVEATAANVADSKMLGSLLHGEETAVWGRPGLPGSGGEAGRACTRGEDRICRRWLSKLQVWPQQRERNRLYSKVCSRVEHVFGILSRALASRRYAIADWPRTCTASGQLRARQPRHRAETPGSRPAVVRV